MPGSIETFGASSNADYRVLFDLLPMPAWIFDRATLQFLSVNAAAVRRYGYSREEFLGMTLDDIRPPEDVAPLHEAIRSHGSVDNRRRHWRHITKSGESFEVQVVSDVMTYGDRPAMVAIVVDQSERRRVQEALFHSRRRLQALFDNALDAILLLDDDGRYIDANPAACVMLGRPRDVILTLYPWDVVVPELVDVTRQAWRDFLRNGSGAGDYRLAAGDDTVREVECRAVANVLPGLHLTMLRDVTARNEARREAERGLHELNDQVRRVSARARARREEDRTRLARELHDQLGQALAGLKIDLCWLSDRVERGIADSDEELQKKIASMTGLVDETILRVRRISGQLRPPVLDRLGLIAAIEWEIEDIKRRTGMHVRLQSRLDHVPLDLGRAMAVFRIFQEAMSNALTHASATQITVRLSKPKDVLTLAISDNGRGIAVDQISSGQSLGLIGMRERAELLNGSVRVKAARPRGTVVTVAIPLAERRRTPRDPWP